jgi:ribosomal protein S18 acetylase RimI-like enzyme
MERPASTPLAQARAPLPATLKWQPLDLARIRDYHRVLSLAFGSIPGAFVAPVDELEQALRRAPEPPLVLMQGERVRAYLQARLHHTELGPLGELRSLGRDPALRGLGLGDHIVRRGISELVARGATRLQLNVAAENSAALALYQRHGFTVIRRIPTMRRRP